MLCLTGQNICKTFILTLFLCDSYCTLMTNWLTFHLKMPGKACSGLILDTFQGIFFFYLFILKKKYFAVIRNSDMMFVIDQTALPLMPTGVSPAAANICVCYFAFFWWLLVIPMALGISVISISFQKDNPAEMRAGGLLMVCLLNPVAWIAMD